MLPSAKFLIASVLSVTLLVSSVSSAPTSVNFRAEITSHFNSAALAHLAVTGRTYQLLEATVSAGKLFKQIVFNGMLLSIGMGIVPAGAPSKRSAKKTIQPTPEDEADVLDSKIPFRILFTVDAELRQNLNKLKNTKTSLKTRRKLALDLGQSSDPRDYVALVYELWHGNDQVREFAALGLRGVPSSGVHDNIRDALVERLKKDENLNVRRQIVETLDYRRDPLTTLAVIIALDDSDLNVQAAAAKALIGLSRDDRAIDLPLAIPLLSITAQNLRSSKVRRIHLLAGEADKALKIITEKYGNNLPLGYAINVIIDYYQRRIAHIEALDELISNLRVFRGQTMVDDAQQTILRFHKEARQRSLIPLGLKDRYLAAKKALSIMMPDVLKEIEPEIVKLNQVHSVLYEVLRALWQQVPHALWSIVLEVIDVKELHRIDQTEFMDQRLIKEIQALLSGESKSFFDADEETEKLKKVGSMIDQIGDAISGVRKGLRALLSVFLHNIPAELISGDALLLKSA